MSFFTPPKGYSPASSMGISLATVGGVFTAYAGKIGPVADVHASASGDVNINAAIKKAGWLSFALVTGAVLLSRDLNVAILGYGAIVFEHTMYLHADMASPANGQISVSPGAYAPAGGQLAAVG